MDELGDLVFDEQWDRVFEAISKDKGLIDNIDPNNLSWKRFQYQLAENRIEELMQPFGNFEDLLKVIDICKKHGMTGVNIPQAVAFQQIEQIKNLLIRGHNIDEIDFGGRTGLLVAAALNDIEIVHFLIENGAFISFCDQEGLEAIDYTTSTEIIEILSMHNGKTESQRHGNRH